MTDHNPQFPGFRDLATENWLGLLRQTNELAQTLSTRSRAIPQISITERDDIDYVKQCYEELAYAYTIDGAMFWHGEIVNELALMVHASQVQPWPEITKQALIDALETRIAEHCAHLSSLCGALQRQDNCTWKP